MRNKQKGFSLIELLIVVAIILIIAAIAIPNLLRAKIAANQASAVGSLRTLNTSCIAFSTSYGQYPAALTNLGPVASGSTASSTSADLIDSVLSAGTKSGYTFKYTAGNANQSYTITATVRRDPGGHFWFGRKQRQHSHRISFSKVHQGTEGEALNASPFPFSGFISRRQTGLPPRGINSID
jgi:type IV pilus assembly protein PilA